ncbi:ribosomal protein S24e family protein [Carex rostrata]
MIRSTLSSGPSRQLRSAPASSHWASAQRFLSAEAGSSDASSDDSFLRSAPEGLVYGKINGRGQSILGKNMLKTDLIHHLEGCDLSFHDIKFEYNRVFFLNSVLVQFPARASFDNAFKQIKLRGNLFNLAKIGRSEWDMKNSYDGKAVLMEGIPYNATLDDIERFLSGCNYDSSSFQFATRTPADSDPIRLVVVKFPTQLDASYAYASKNRSFCLSTPVNMRILQ